MGLVVIHPGVSSTVQDEGRAGYREWGVPLDGWFDGRSAALANALVGNPRGSAVLELTMFGGVYEARTPLALSLAGAPLAASIESDGSPTRPLVLPQSFSVAPGERLCLGGGSIGARTYLAVKGGWKTPPLLGSRSREERLKPGDLLDAEPGSQPARRPAESFWEAPNRRPLRIIDGPDSTQAVELEAWLRASFRVGRQVDRMGVRLEGPDLKVESPPGRLSTPVAPGALQIAGGQAIVLGVACGTMGGYPHVSHVISADFGRVGQLRPGDQIEFQRVTLEDARRIDRAERKSWSERLQWLAALAQDDHALPPFTGD